MAYAAWPTPNPNHEECVMAEPPNPKPEPQAIEAKPKAILRKVLDEAAVSKCCISAPLRSLVNGNPSRAARALWLMAQRISVLENGSDRHT